MVEISAATRARRAGRADREGRCGPTDYTPEACTQVVTIMGTGLSLTAAAGAMGISSETIHRWMDAHEEFRDAVSRGEAARVLALESQMLASENSAVVNARRFALVNAAPEEWREKPEVDPDEAAASPIRLLAEQISGNAIRPRPQKPKIIEHEPVASRASEPQMRVIIDDADDDEPRIHTVSRESYEDEGTGGLGREPIN